ncbi:MAG: 1-acyl-sn-glycerol-3-phosphate acyltransferase [Polyangiaceae bacterium]
MLLPPSLLHRLYDPFLRRIDVDEGWAATLRGAASRGAVIHVVRNVSLLDLLALTHLSSRHHLPEIAFANDFGEVLSRAPRAFFAPKEDPEQSLRKAVLSGKSAVLFLKRAPGVIERASTAHRGKTEGDALLSVLIDIAHKGSREVLLVPQTLVWTLRPERRGFWARDFLFSPAEFPGEVRALAQLSANHEHVVVRAGEPLVLRDFLNSQSPGDPHVVRRLVYALLRKVERERKSVVGPAQKPPDRVREEVLKSPRLAGVLRDMSAGDPARLTEVMGSARDMLRELQAEPDPSTMRVLESMADTLAERVFAGIDVDIEGIERVRDAARKGSIVLLPSHKSHVDYLLLHYVLRKHALTVPLVAAGDNLSFFPIGPLLRRSGAFFIRRSFRGDKLYAIVVDAYVRRLLRDGHALEFFLEGGRSRTGKLLPPQLGLLNMVVEAALGLGDRPVSFVPVSIGYERMMEETEFLRELSGGTKRPEDMRSLMDAGRALLQSYGRPNVQFGRVLDLADLRRSMHLPAEPTPARRRALVSNLAQTVMDEINRVTAVTPGALVATVLLCHPRRGMPHKELTARARRLLALVTQMGARLTPSLTEGPGGPLCESALREAAEVYVRGGLLRRHVPGDTLTGVGDKRAPAPGEEDVIWVVPEERRIALDIPKNMIVHLFVDRAFVSLALGARDETATLPDSDVAHPPVHDTTPPAVLARARTLARLFRHELMVREGPAFEARLSQTIQSMLIGGDLVADARSAALLPGPGHDGLDGRGWLLFYNSVLRNFLEGYRVAARALRTLVSAPEARSKLVMTALGIGEQMFLGGEIERAEAVSRPLIDTALLAFRDLGYLERDGDTIALAPAHNTPEAAAAIEGTLARYLARPAYDIGF